MIPADRRARIVRTGPWLALSLVALSSLLSSSSRADDRASFFEAKIRPVLVGSCFKCHGGEKESAGLRVDSLERLARGGESGAAIVPGKPDESLLVSALRRDGLEMPPDAALPADVVRDFEQWIAAGAFWPESATAQSWQAAGRHWAFELARPVEPPAADNAWSDHPVDRFIAAKWSARGLKPVAPADKRVLVRRAYFDLVGLPPSPAQMAAHLSDASPDWFARLVDGLLASPRYGERWGRHWMDVARYADTAGDNADYPVPEVALYRDYIIDSFNTDKPYNEFVQEQLAGDLLAKTGPRDKHAERVAATGFLALSRRYGTMPGELWHLTLEDTIDTVGQAFLGLTLRCARCHDHKFDPVTMRDYYALYGIFASTRFAYAGSEEFQSKKLPRSGFVPLVPDDEARPALERYAQEIAAGETRIKEAEQSGPLAQQIAALRKRMDEQLAATDSGAGDSSTADNDTVDNDTGDNDTAAGGATGENDDVAALRRELDEMSGKQKQELDKLRDQLHQLRKPGFPAGLDGAYAVTDASPIDVPIQKRGEPAQPGETVARDAPRFLSGAGHLQIPPGASGRLELARWLTTPDNPLTARVLVNRVWQQHFGVGIVATASNFGLRGAAPTHPELLDWLAGRFVESGWSIKSLHRLIMSSQTYQLASDQDEHNAQTDPANQFYWRYNARRLDAEALRDSLLAVAGALDLNRPGRHPFPPIEKWNWTQHNAFKEVYPSRHRSVYLMTQRLQRHPYLALFDGPDTNHTTESRTSATAPLQSLYLMNNPFVLEQSQALADRLLATGANDRARVELAYELAWGRPAAADEIDRALDYLDRYERAIAAEDLAEPARTREAWSSLAKVMLTANEFLYVD